MSASPWRPVAELGKYRIDRVLGVGGMGQVLLAYDPSLQRRVALKILVSLDQDDAARHRLVLEARSASALNHPNICTVYEVGEDSGRAFIAMEYVEGRTLSQIIAEGRLPIADAVRYGSEVADALAHAHERGVVHRDLKAANAIVMSSGRIKIVDFGLAQRTEGSLVNETTYRSPTESRVVAGTPYAMAPEQVRAQTVDARTDIWALGVLLYEMLSGEKPFKGDTLGELSASILRDPPRPVPSALPRPLHDAVITCLAKDPGQRYQRAADVRLVLDVISSGLRGHTEPVSAPSPAGPTPPPPALNAVPGATTFVGRAAEREQAEHVWARAAAGSRELLFISGEPGIGKTRFALEFARTRAAESAILLVGRCEEEALVPYQPFVEALTWYFRVCPEPELRSMLTAVGGGGELGQLVPELQRRVPDLPQPMALNPDAQRFRLFETVNAVLSQMSSTYPVLLVLDDLHWADKATLLMLRHIIRSRDAASLCLVGTYRESELARTHPFAELLADLRREETVTRLSLRGLDESQVRQLVDAFAASGAHPDFARAVRNSTAGNPFFVAEVLRHLLETGALARLAEHATTALDPVAALGLPEGVKEVIGRRLSRLSDDCNRVLSLGAVIGREFDLAVLEALGDLPEAGLLDAVEEASRAQLVSEVPDRPGRFSFLHALIRETLYAELTSARRVRMHRRVAEAIERITQGSADPPLADLAYHFSEAASTAVAHKAVDYAIRAGDRAATALAYEEAARFYEVALHSLDIAPASPDETAHRISLHQQRARAFGAISQWGPQKAELMQALAHVAPDQIEVRSELLLQQATACFWLLDLPSVGRLATEALQLADTVQRSDIAADATAWLARCKQGNGDLHGAIEMDRVAIARAGAITTTALSTALSPAPLALYLAGQNAEAISQASKAATFARTSRDTQLTMHALAHLGLGLGSAGRYREASATFDEAREFGRKYGIRPLLARATAMAAGHHLSVFDFDGAEALQTEAREIGRANFQPAVVSAGIDLLLTYARRHDLTGADGLLQETSTTAAEIAGWHGWLWRIRLCQARAELALARGDLDIAVAEASEGIRLSQTSPRPKYETLGLITRARALNGIGRQQDARADADAGVAIARRLEDPALLLQAMDALLELSGGSELAAEANALSARIVEALPDETMRGRFIVSEVVQRIRRQGQAAL